MRSKINQGFRAEVEEDWASDQLPLLNRRVARGGAVPPQAQINAVSGRKSPAFRVTQSSPSAALRRLTAAPHRT
jgi:hypothetical protein